MFDPPPRTSSSWIVVRPMQNSPAIVPLILTADFDAVPLGRGNAFGKVNIVGDQDRVSSRQS